MAKHIAGSMNGGCTRVSCGQACWAAMDCLTQNLLTRNLPCCAHSFGLAYGEGEHPNKFIGEAMFGLSRELGRAV